MIRNEPTAEAPPGRGAGHQEPWLRGASAVGSSSLVLTLPGFLSAEECTGLLAADLPEKMAEMYAADPQGAPIVDQRQYSARLMFVAWPWLLVRCNQALVHARRAFGLPPLDLRESPRIARYDVGGLFDWHHDAAVAGQRGTPPRVVTASVPLVPETEYAGGALEVQDGEGGVVTASRLVGEATLFPAQLLHRVAPVTRGTRTVLVFWGY